MKLFSGFKVQFLKACLMMMATMALALNAQESTKDAIAVLNLEGQGISNLEAQTLTGRFASTLSQIGKMTLVERSKMESILKEQEFQQSGCTDSDCAVEIGELLNVQFLVSGGIGKLGDTYTVDVKMFSVETGAVAKTVTSQYQGSIEGLIVEVEILAWEMMEESVPQDLLNRRGSDDTEAQLENVAILSFVGRGISNMEAETLTDRFSSSITQLEMMQLVQTQEMDEILSEQGFGGDACSDAACAVEIGKLLNVEYMISGSIGTIGKTYTVDIKMYEVGSGEMAKAYKVNTSSLEGLLLEVEIGAQALMGLPPNRDQLAQRRIIRKGGTTGSSEKTMGKAMVRAVVPGWGHLYLGEKKVWGWGFLAGETAALAMLFLADQGYNDAIAEQDSYQQLYLNTSVQSEMDHYKALRDDAFDLATQKNDQRTIFAAVSGGLFIANFIHLFVRHKDSEALTDATGAHPLDNPGKLSFYTTSNEIGMQFALPAY